MWKNSLRPRAEDIRASETAKALGGMRHPAKAIGRLTEAHKVGAHLRSLFEGLLERLPRAREACISAIGSQDPNSGPDEKIFEGTGASSASSSMPTPSRAFRRNCTRRPSARAS